MVRGSTQKQETTDLAGCSAVLRGTFSQPSGGSRPRKRLTLGEGDADDEGPRPSVWKSTKTSGDSERIVSSSAATLV